MRINLKDIENSVKPIAHLNSYDKEFIFDLLLAYGRSSSSITRLRSGYLNIAEDKESEIAQKNVVYFKPTTESPYVVIDDLKSTSTVVRYNIRFVIVTDYKKLLAIDTKTNETLDINIEDIDKHYAFFLPWAGMEKAQFIAENHADVKAAEKMSNLFDELIRYNGFTTALEWHNLSVFFTRLLFCFFAEDTNIFQKNQFINAVASYTQDDGSDLKIFLRDLFASLDDKDKEGYPSHLAVFPYVNGALFRDFSEIPNFNKESRNLLIESASKLDWSSINPDIFGSMFQQIVRPGDRAGLGQHYTSVPNIMKTIEPLFLDELKELFNDSYDDSVKLEKLLMRISGIKVFDPACGSGNFLIIAYKELRKLEHAILERQGELGTTSAILLGSRISIENFYGIEIDDFAHEVAILSLWLAKHQMNIDFAEKFGIELALIPLKESGNIIQGNSARLNWFDLYPIKEGDELYLIANPPYAGARRQKASHKTDMSYCFEKITSSYKNMDYVAIWFYKSAEYVSKSKKSAAALVSTNSVSQGQQVELMWPLVFNFGVAIDYAYTSFKWSNNAKGNAGITCVIIALSCRENTKRFIETEHVRVSVKEISPYLKEKLHDNIIGSRSKPVSDIPKMEFGNMPLDEGNLILSEEEKNNLLRKSPDVAPYLRRLYGANEYIKDIHRWCIWIDDKDLDKALNIPEIKQRVDKVRTFRSRSKDAGTRKKASKPHQFREHKTANKISLIIPATSSENRLYIPIGFLAPTDIISNLAQVIYDPEVYVFGIISSKMHMNWVKAVAGRLKTDFRYSSAIVYNNFPIPPLTNNEKEAIETRVLNVLDVRESYSEKTLAELYKSTSMPDDLRLAHEDLDDAIEKIYRNKPFESDAERLAHLFELYEKMTVSEKGEN